MITQSSLFHYYPKDEAPFRSLSSLSQEEALTIIENYCPDSALVHRRFKDPKSYLESRKETESWLREEFIKKGGSPKTDHPIYLTLGHSSYIYEGYNQNCKKIEISLSKLDLSEVSFTYPDSMVSYWLANQKRDQEYFNPKYHGKVFTYTEIIEQLKETPHKDGIWMSDRTRAYDFFVEAQLWADSNEL